MGSYAFITHPVHGPVTVVLPEVCEGTFDKRVELAPLGELERLTEAKDDCGTVGRDCGVVV
jgi:hypothetical protein